MCPVFFKIINLNSLFRKEINLSLRTLLGLQKSRSNLIFGNFELTMTVCMVRQILTIRTLEANQNFKRLSSTWVQCGPEAYQQDSVHDNQSWALSVFLNFFNTKKWFCIFIKLIWLGVDFLNRTGAGIGY